MHKKLWIGLLTASLTLALAAGLTACGEDSATPTTQHTHNYVWVDNGDGTHKQHCYNDGCTAPDVNSGNHVWNTDGKCEKCDAEKPDDGSDPLPPVSSESKIESVSSALKQDSATAYSLKEKLASAQTSYDLTDKITVSAGAEFKVYSDLNCTQQLNASAIELTGNTTTVYIKVTGGESSSVYKLTLDKNAVFHVRLYYNETELYYDGTVEEGSDEITLPKPQLEDYTFENGYYTDVTYKNKFDGKITQDTALYLSASYHGVTLNGSTVTGLKGNPKGRVNLVIDANGATSIKPDAFKNCVQLNSVTVSDAISEIGEGAFRGCNTLESMTVPFTGKNGTGTYREATCSFAYIFGAENKAVGRQSGSSVTVDIEYQWNDDEYYYWAHVPETLKTVTVTGGETVSFLRCFNIYNAEILHKVNDFMFGDCYSLREVSLPDGITSIPKASFSGCYKLRRITIPESVTEIGIRAFYQCNDLMEVCNKSSLDSTVFNTGSLSEPKPVERVYTSSTEKSNITVTDDGFAFYSDDNKTVILDYEGTEPVITLPSDFNGKGYSIKKGTFNYNLNLVSITVPQGVTAIEENALIMINNIFEIYNLSGVEYEFKLNAVFSNNYRTCHYSTSASEKSQITVKDGFIFFTDSEDKNWLVGYNGTETNLVLPDDCNGNTYGIYNSCFSSYHSSSDYGDVYLESVVIGDGVTSIGSNAFSRSLIKSVTVGKNVAEIGADAFALCSQLKTVDWGATHCKFVTNSSATNDAPFMGVSMETLTIQENVTYLSAYLFYYAKPQTVVFEATSGWSVTLGSTTIKVKESNLSDNDYTIRQLTQDSGGSANFTWTRTV